MRFIMYGAGAIGGSIGARLFEAGHEVVLICRGAHLDTIRAEGLLLRAPEGDVRLPIPAAGHPREIDFRSDDVVILSMKSQDTERALYDLETHGGADLPIVCAQNGVDNERMAARRFARVYGMLVAMPATFLTPGEVVAEGTPLTGVLHTGRYPEGLDETAEAVCAAISRSHMLAEPEARVMRLKYTKLLANLGNAFQVVTGLSAWGGAGDEAREFMTRVRREGAAVYRAAGIDAASQEEYQARANSHFRIGDVAGQQRGGSSTWQSVQKGHTVIEADYLNGEIVLLGRLHGVPTPYNSVLRRLAVRIAAGGGAHPTYSIEELERAVQAEVERQPAAAG
jgi:2-dehydropantoate 2-reductase